MRNRARYSAIFQLIEEYAFARLPISYAATRNQDQCKKTSIPAERKRRIDPWRVFIPKLTTHRLGRRFIGKRRSQIDNPMTFSATAPRTSGCGSSRFPKLTLFGRRAIASV